MSKFISMKFEINDNPELSTSIQRALYSKGYRWFGRDEQHVCRNGWVPSATDHFFLYANDNGYLGTRYGTSADREKFNKDPHKLSTLGDLRD